jgi:wyosine [tRNA(Phe)-imidazoG37] synthetase (radical SAM superfamily)
MPYVFGPVPSRRLGLSLGIDLIPAKTCTYDCLYCQVGRTTCKTIEAGLFIPIQEVLAELEQKLGKMKPDFVTLAGSGEPTLHSHIDKVITFIKRITGIKIALLTNGSLLWNEEVRNRVSGSDVIIPTLTTAFEETFRSIHRPCPELSLPLIIEGLKSLRQAYQGQIFLEVVLLAGFNDSNREIEGLKSVIDEISPDRVQLNTVVRPPADSRAIPLDIKRLESIKETFGESAEIITGHALKQKGGRQDSLITAIVEMAKRRPVSSADVAHALGLPLDEAEGLIKGLRIKGLLRQQEHSGKVFYLSDG